VISVIVPCRGCADDLADLLSSLQVQAARPTLGATDGGSPDAGFEVIVVDSGLDDDVQATAERFGARCLRGDTPLLPGQARNLGARHARGTGFAFIDSDAIAEPGWIAAAAESLQKGPMAGGPVLDRLPWYTVASIDNLLQFADFGADRPPGPIRHVPSCNMAVRRDVFFTVGGFSDDMPWGEDVLLTNRLHERWPGALWFAPEMRVAHLGRGRLGTMLSHQHCFGYARGVLGLHLTERQRRWAGRAFLLPAVALKHLTYVCRRGLRYGRLPLLGMAMIMPLLLMGALAWAAGLRRGLRAAEAAPTC
jgi:glycosyltransferase involved in cell wall biosynthesis